jgi:hypothetical protein
MLKELILLAETGELKGMAIVLKFSQTDHKAGIFGDYRQSPIEALQATLVMENKLCKEISPVYAS